LKSFLAAMLAFAAAAPALAAPPPKLIVAISVDQFSADLFAEYRSRFTGGLKRLAGGVVFPSGYQSHNATETCPGHSTILTGARPSRTGIIANNWFELGIARPDKRVYCAEDWNAPGTDSEKYRVTTATLKVPTLGDRMKAANPASRVVAVAGKDRAAVMMGGHATDQIWYWGGKAFVTLPDRTGPAPAAVAPINARVAALVAKGSKAALPAQCRAYSMAVPAGSIEVGILADRAAEDFRGFRSAGEFDAATADLAIGLLREMKLGQGAAPDLLALGLSATDYVGHSFGTEGAEMCAQMAALDATVDRLLAALDATRVPYQIVLTADHGGQDLPERNVRRAMPDAARAAPLLRPQDFGKALAAETGFKGETLIHGDGPFGDFYLSRDVSDADRPRILAAARAKLLAQPQVAAVFTADELRRMSSPTGLPDEWTLADRARASFDAERSGDLIVMLRAQIAPIVTPGKGYVATHGSPWNYDRRVPILFWRPGGPGFEQPNPVETVDILPTLAALIALPVPKDQIDGRCLDLDPGAGDSCAK
jgi:predicted AlkP superfamily pyrophosphatase or phosphodiesterase